MVAVVSVAFVRPVSHCLGKSKYLCFSFFPFNQVFDRFDRRGGGSVDYLRFLELIGFSATHTSSSATRTRGGYWWWWRRWRWRWKAGKLCISNTHNACIEMYVCMYVCIISILLITVKTIFYCRNWIYFFSDDCAHPMWTSIWYRCPTLLRPKSALLLLLLLLLPSTLTDMSTYPIMGGTRSLRI